MSVVSFINRAEYSYLQYNTHVYLKVNATDADVTFQSSDNILFHVHRKNLETHAAGFPPPGFETNGEVTQLTEHSSTLETLFQFIYPKRQPDVECMEFEDLALLAEASEKYEIFSAINVCRLCMKAVLPAHAKEVMCYAARHGYKSILHQAAPLLLDIPLQLSLVDLPSNIIIPWVLYYQKWNEVLQKSVSRHANLTTHKNKQSYHNGQQDINYTMRDCPSCGMKVDSIVLDILSRMDCLRSLFNLDTVFTKRLGCVHMQPTICTWRKAIQEDVDAIGSFVAYL